MKTALPWLWALMLVIGQSNHAPAQLAITEAMSAATRVQTTVWLRYPDYWELTNFGTNEVRLHGYGFRDSDPTHNLQRDPFTNLVVRGGESVIFFQVDVDAAARTPAEFRAWWGEAQLPTNLQCRIWKSPGLSGWDGDAIWLFNPLGEVVDHVQFGRAQPGRAFTYDPETGLFGRLSVAGSDGAFVAGRAEDIGSPGTTAGAVGVRILQPPADQSADAGGTATFSVSAAGLPAPRYQWFAHGIPLAGAHSEALVLANVQPADAGEYSVLVTNGLSAAMSPVAILTVSTNLRAPVIVQPPADLTVFEGQAAVFTVVAQGLPLPIYTWRANGIELPGASGPVLQIPSVDPSFSGTRYAVCVSNALGAAERSAVLTVTRRPDLRFTEVMALPANEKENRHFDWFELTNFDTNAINLQGWRFADAPSFARACTVTNALVLEPGDSAVFAERLNVAQFAAWWGTDALPARFKFATYSGFGLGASGDTLCLWNAAATDPHDPLATASWAGASAGISLECEHWCDPEGYGCLDDGRTDSVAGVHGAFAAEDGGDIGSPGYVTTPPIRILSVRAEPSGAIRLQCRTVPHAAYRLERGRSLEQPGWETIQTRTATNNVLTWTDTLPEPGTVWFYRVGEVR